MRQHTQGQGFELVQNTRILTFGATLTQRFHEDFFTTTLALAAGVSAPVSADKRWHYLFS